MVVLLPLEADRQDTEGLEFSASALSCLQHSVVIEFFTAKLFLSKNVPERFAADLSQPPPVFCVFCTANIQLKKHALDSWVEPKSR